MVGAREKMKDDVSFRVLRLLEQNPEMSQRDLSKAVGISTGSIHYVLKALMEKGLVKFSNFSASKDKRRYAYVLTPKGLTTKASLTRRFLARKMAEYELLKAEIEDVRGDLTDEEMIALKQSLENERG